MPLRRFDPQPMRRDDQNDDIGERGKRFEAGSGMERGGFQIGAGGFDAALEFVVERSDLLVEILLRGLGIVEAGGFVFVLADKGLPDEFGAAFAAPGVRRQCRGLLQRFQLLFNFFHFTFFDGAIGRVNNVVAGFPIEGIDFYARAVGVNGDDHVANGDGALVSRFQEVARGDGVFADFKKDLAGAVPWLEKRSGVDHFGAGQDGFFVEDEGAVNNFVVDDGEDRLANFDECSWKLANEPGSGESFFCRTGCWKEKQQQRRNCNESNAG